MRRLTTNIKVTKFSASLLLLFLFPASNLFAGDTFRLSPNTYTETMDFDSLPKNLFGEAASLADWSNIKSMIGNDNVKLAEFYNRIGLEDEAAAWVLKDGNRYNSGNRHYFIQRFSNGKPVGFLAHDQIGTLYLGSWYGMSISILVETNNDTCSYRLSASKYNENLDFDSLPKNLFGEEVSLADWSNIKSMIGADNSKLVEFYSQIGFANEAAAWVSKDGNRFYSGNRHYFIQRFDNGKPVGFLAHDQIGSLYLGSWYGMNINILVQKNTNATSINDLLMLTPNKFNLFQNYPNPFNPSTNISFYLYKRSFVQLNIFDLSGKEVTTIISKEMPAGMHCCIWNAHGLSSGVYYYRIQADKFTQTKKLILLR